MVSGLMACHLTHENQKRNWVVKLSFSTLGCPEWSIDEVCEKAKGYGYQGVGIRGIGGEFDLTKIAAFQDADRNRVIRKFSDAGIAFVIMSTSCRFTSPDKDERAKHFQDGKDAIDIAEKMGSKMIRVFGGGISPEVRKEDAYGWVVDNFKALGDYGGPKGVTVAIETHDDFSDTGVVREIMERANHEHVGVLWDVHHPYRACGNSMQMCWDNLGKYIVHTHFKDSKLDPEQKSGFKYCLMGEGDIPNIEALQILKDNNYQGFLSLEWEKAWHPYLADPSVAFPQYASKMKEYISGLRG